MKTTRRTFFGQLLGWAAAPFIAKAVPIPEQSRYWMGIDLAAGPSNTHAALIEFDQQSGLWRTVQAFECFNESLDKIRRKLDKCSHSS